MSLKKLAGDTAIYGVSSVLGRLLNFVLITPFVTRPSVFSPEQYGVVSDLFFFTAFFIAFLVFRMDTVVFRFASRSVYSAEVICRRAQNMIWVGVLLWLAIGLGLAPAIAKWMQYPDRVVYVRLFVLVVAFDVLAAVPLARLRLEGRAWFFATVNIGNILVNIVLIYGLLLFVPRWIEAGYDHLGWYEERFKIAYYFAAILAAGVFRYILLVVDRWQQRKSSVAPLDEDLPGQAAEDFRLQSSQVKVGAKSPDPLVPSRRTMINYAAPLVVVAICGIINTLIGPTMLKYYHGGTVTQNLYWVGQYGAAMKMAVFLTLFTTAYNFAAEPFFFRRRSDHPDEKDLSIYADATRIFALVCALAIAAILLLLPVLQYYLGEKLREGLEVLPILMAANFFLAIYYNFSLAYKLTDKTHLGGLIALGGAFIVVLGNIFFIESLSIYAPAYAGLACFVFMTVMAYWVSRKYFPVPYAIGRMTYYAALTTLVVYLGWPLEELLPRIGLLLLLTGTLLTSEWKWLKTLV